MARWPIHFGKYELLSRINIGGMAEIVKACDTSLPSRPMVAVKRILPHLCEDAQYKTMFLDESRVLAQLDHPNIIHAFEIGEVEGQPYIALDYVDGQDARTLFHRTRGDETRVPIAIACYILACVCDGLHHAHEQTDEQGQLLGLVHRDVSLQNVLLSYAGDVKLTDFGIAVSSLNEARTAVGIVKGKFGYMSPEQIRGAPLDRRSDVFGAGICLYELLTGERLFLGDNDYKAIERVRNVDIEPPSKWNRNIPSDLERIVLKALAKQPRDRYQNALEMRRELLAFMSSAGERCTRDDLGRYLREVFASEFEEPGEGTTTIHSGPELEAARAAAVAIPAGAAATSSALDGTTGLAAFDHLDPVSSVTFAADAEPQSFVRLPAAAAIPSLRASRPSGTLPPPGLAAVPASRPAEPPRSAGDRLSSEGSRPSGASLPAVPPVVPHPDSIPGTVQAAELLGDLGEGDGDNDNAVPEPRPMTMEWDEHEPTTISQGFVDPVNPISDPFVNEEEVTRVHTDEPLPGMATSLNTDRFPPAAIGGGQDTTSRPPITEDIAAPARATPRGFEQGLPPDTVLRVVAVVLGMLVVIFGGLYWARESGPGTIRMSTDPRDAVVTVDGKRVPASASPFVLSDLDTSDEHTIAVDKVGYQGWSTRLKLRPDQVLDLPLIKLEPDRPPQPVAAIPVAPPPAASAPPEVREEHRKPAPAERKPAARATHTEPKAKKASSPKPAAPAPKPARPAAASSGAMGTLRLNSRPWSRVTIDGKLIGNTPQFNIPLRAGSHSVNLVNPEFGLNKTVTIEIKPGEVVTKVLSLQ
ncbi:MAG TPA: protein kinase [Polyangiales bacterium]|nr:protein kinase [Polyangiales bacterium]